MSEHFDAIVIGAGQAGPALAGRLGQEGLKTAIIERHLMGGTCVNTGCIPTKTLVASARVAYLARRAAEFGVSIDSPVSVDMTRVKARKDDIVEASNSGVTAWVEGMENVTLIRGHARFEGPRSISVKGETLSAENIFIDVGARARLPDLPGIQAVNYRRCLSSFQRYCSRCDHCVFNVFIERHHELLFSCEEQSQPSHYGICWLGPAGCVGENPPAGNKLRA